VSPHGDAFLRPAAKGAPCFRTVCVARDERGAAIGDSYQRFAENLKIVCREQGASVVDEDSPIRDRIWRIQVDKVIWNDSVERFTEIGFDDGGAAKQRAACLELLKCGDVVGFWSAVGNVEVASSVRTEESVETESVQEDETRCTSRGRQGSWAARSY